MVFPIQTKIIMYKSMKLQCDTDHPYWFFKTPMGQSIYSLEDVIILDNVTLKDNGDYYCYGSYRDREGHFLAKATVKVYGMLNVYYGLKLLQIN